MFVAEPAFLLYDEVREPATHLAILKSIGVGNHTLSEIANGALVGKSHLSAYPAYLQTCNYKVDYNSLIHTTSDEVFDDQVCES